MVLISILVKYGHTFIRFSKTIKNTVNIKYEMFRKRKQYNIAYKWDTLLFYHQNWTKHLLHLLCTKLYRSYPNHLFQIQTTTHQIRSTCYQKETTARKF